MKNRELIEKLQKLNPELDVKIIDINDEMRTIHENDIDTVEELFYGNNGKVYNKYNQTIKSDEKWAIMVKEGRYFILLS